MDHIFFDLDGTLSFNGKISERNCAALRAVREMGHEVILNTGRGRGYLPDWVLKAVTFDGICCGGVYLSYHGREYYSYVMRPEDAAASLRAAALHKIPVAIEGADFSAEYLRERTDRTLLIREGELEEFIASPYISRIAKLCFITPTLPDGFQTPGLYTIPFPTYIEGAPIGFDKASPMRYLAAHCGVVWENTFAVGDSLNDEAMLAAAARCAVIGHAPAALDRYHPFRSTLEEDGVYEILSHFYGIHL